MSKESSVKRTLLRWKRRLLANYSLVGKVMAVVGLIAVLFIVGRFLSPALKLAKEFLWGPVNVVSVVLNRSSELKNDNGRTNVLLLGIGGGAHEGPNLTDSMIVLSAMTKLDTANTKTPLQVNLISLPRDIYIDSLQDKINSAYKEGLDKGVGTVLVKSVVGQITGLPIHYVVVLDFSAFSEVIDILGGIDVNVEATLDDPAYPLAGKETETCGFSPSEVTARAATINLSPDSEYQAFPCRYESLHFDPGLRHMGGETALKFVRSRHAEGDQGTDFARSRRQQLVIKAIKDKALSSETLLSPQKILDIYSQIKSHVTSDLDSSELSVAINLALKYKNAPIKTAAIDETLLENPPVDYRGWILLPKNGSWDQVHEFVKSQLESQQ